MGIGIIVLYFIILLFFIPLPFIYYVFEKNGKKNIWIFILFLAILYFTIIYIITSDI